MPFGDLPQGASPATRDFIYWSATRGPTTDPPLPKPTVTVGGQDPFLKVGEPIELTPEELASLAVQLTIEGKGAPVRVRGGYRVPVTLHRHLPGKPSPGSPAEPDIGPYERQVGVTAAGTLQTVPIPVTANILGLVGLIDAQAADLKQFNGNGGVEKPFNLASDRTDLVLRPLPDEFKPSGVLKVSLSEPQPAGGTRRVWTLKVGVSPGAGWGRCRRTAWSCWRRRRRTASARSASR